MELIENSETSLAGIRRVKKQELLAKVNSVLQEILTESGQRALIYYLRTNFGVSFNDMVERPSELEYALTSLFGEYGSEVLKARITKAIGGLQDSGTSAQLSVAGYRFAAGYSGLGENYPLPEPAPYA